MMNRDQIYISDKNIDSINENKKKKEKKKKKKNLYYIHTNNNRYILFHYVLNNISNIYVSYTTIQKKISI
ncbi:hypothetical protein PFBG_00178 [Plasmodium falciparum 7G8]|uniref:Uncharacterized protein n=1 Tax=Plasmodium falciparum (isolate 7G8) TaxID=57266 RepID=W7FMN4_PLAF8|nr:hypothetical protein PFBG_00178 [Plasmodium falciparum 7G8]